MIYTDMTKKAMKIAYKAHEGQTDKSGIPYVCHPLHVAEQMEDETSTAAALLHDVLEDTGVTLLELKEAGFPKAVLEAVALLTRGAEVPYLDYIRKLRNNPVARNVKLADLVHNSDISRLDQVTEEDKKRLHVYAQSIEILKKN